MKTESERWAENDTRNAEDNALFEDAVAQPYRPRATPVIAAATGEEPLMRFFDYVLLPEELYQVQRAYKQLAKSITETLPRCAERTVALRKLLEAKDAAVRAALPE